MVIQGSRGFVFDVIVVGAGPAGLMTAIICGRHSLRVLLIDGQKNIGAKLLITGGGRCNVTNRRVSEKDFASECPKAVRNVLRSFKSEKTTDFFSELGVEFVEETGGKLFVRSQEAKDILDALVTELRKYEILLEPASRVENVKFREALFQVTGKGFNYSGRTLVIATGGLSYPETGSDGSGYGLAQSFGHHIIPTHPALTPLETDDPDWKSLTGISFPCRLTLHIGKKEIVSFEDDLLFTHSGFSGPCSLSMSRYWIRHRGSPEAVVTASFLPDYDESKLRDFFTHEVKRNPTKLLKSVLGAMLAERFVEVLMKKTAVSETVTMSHFKKEDRERLILALLKFPLAITGASGYEKAEVTAGGIDFQEVDSKTLQSKLQRGLFFAGEILDADGRVGGFNLQWAWASGFVAGSGINKFIHEGKA